MSRVSSTRDGAPSLATAIIARPNWLVVVIAFGNARRIVGNKGRGSEIAIWYTAVFERIPSIGWIIPGRYIYAALNGMRSSAFSARPLTRAHMLRPRSVVSVPAPVTYEKVMPGLRRDKVRPTANVKSYVKCV